MALTPGTIKRAVDGSGDDIKVFTDGGGAEIQGVALVDENGDHAGVPSNGLITEGRGLSYESTGAAAERSHVVKNSPGTLWMFRALGTSGAPDLWVMVLDQVAAPAGGEVPVWRAFLPAGGEIGDDFFPGGRSFANGIVIAVSSTPGTWTDPGSDYAFFHVGFE